MTAYDDGVAQAQMYGTFFVDNATYLRNNTSQKDPRPGGDSVFERTSFLYCIYTSASGGMAWREWETEQSAKTGTNTWFSQYDRHAFPSRAEKGRMRTQVCEDHGWKPDPCSAWPQWTTNLCGFAARSGHPAA